VNFNVANILGEIKPSRKIGGYTRGEIFLGGKKGNIRRKQQRGRFIPRDVREKGFYKNFKKTWDSP